MAIERKIKSPFNQYKENLSQAIIARNYSAVEKWVKKLVEVLPLYATHLSSPEQGKENAHKLDDLLTLNLKLAIEQFKEAISLKDAMASLSIYKFLFNAINENKKHLMAHDKITIDPSMSCHWKLLEIVVQKQAKNSQIIAQIHEFSASEDSSKDAKIQALLQCLNIIINQLRLNLSASERNNYYAIMTCLAFNLHRLDRHLFMGDLREKIPPPPKDYSNHNLTTLLEKQDPGLAKLLLKGWAALPSSLDKPGISASNFFADLGLGLSDIKFKITHFFSLAKDKKTVPGLKPKQFELPMYLSANIPDASWQKAIEDLCVQADKDRVKHFNAYCHLLYADAKAKLISAKPNAIEFYDAHSQFINSLIYRQLGKFERIPDDTRESAQKKTAIYRNIFSLVQCLIELEEIYWEMYGQDKLGEFFPETLMGRLGVYQPKLLYPEEALPYCPLTFYVRQLEKIMIPLVKLGHDFFQAGQIEVIERQNYSIELLRNEFHSKTTIREGVNLFPTCMSQYPIITEQVESILEEKQRYKKSAELTGAQIVAITRFNQQLKDKAVTYKSIAESFGKMQSELTGKLNAVALDIVFDYLQAEGEADNPPVPK